MTKLGSVLAVFGLEDHDTCYNGTIHRIDQEHWYFLHRRNRAVRNGCGRDYLEGCLLDRNFFPLTAWSCLGLPGTLWEDPRFFPQPGGWGVVFGGPSTDPADWRRRRVFCASLAREGWRFRIREESLRSLQRVDGGAPCEKNWLPFMAEGSQLILYTVSPHVVLEVVGADEQTIWTRSAFTTDWGFDFPGSPCSCGTVPIQISDDEFLTFFHSVEYPHLYAASSSLRKERELSHTRLYRMGAYTFSVRPPFRILRATRDPIEYPGIYSVPNRRVTRDDRVVFPSGAVLVGSDVIISVGENDSCTKILRFSLGEIQESSGACAAWSIPIRALSASPLRSLEGIHQATENV